ncbi:MAG TPA: hypothetical protein VH277_18450 [Gemmatimonadaceae bacterium]|nr:hypothetical protein [Gemmatimonadaceae bacterium]
MTTETLRPTSVPQWAQNGSPAEVSSPHRGQTPWGAEAVACWPDGVPARPATPATPATPSLTRVAGTYADAAPSRADAT